MQNLIRAFFALATIVIISILLFYGYENKKYGNPSLDKPSHQVIRIGDEDDYYELTIPREFGAVQSKDNTNAVFLSQILYPEMKRWEAEPRDRADMIGLSITYNLNELMRNNTRDYALEKVVKQYSFLTKITDASSNKLIKKYPDIKVYANKKTKEVSDYVFSDKNGFLVVINLIGKISERDARVYASYKGKFEIDFYIPGKFFYETPDVVNAVIDLISTFNPTHYKNHNSQYESTIDQEIESQKLKEKISNKTVTNQINNEHSIKK